MEHSRDAIEKFRGNISLLEKSAEAALAFDAFFTLAYGWYMPKPETRNSTVGLVI